MKLIDSISDWEILVNHVLGKDVLVVPIFIDQKKHPGMNTVSVIGISTDTDSWVVGCNHNEVVLNFSIDDITSCLKNCNKVWTPNKSTLMYICPIDNIYDVWSLEYLSTQTPPTDDLLLTSLHQVMYSKYDRYLNINKSIPIMKHIEYMDDLFAYYKNIIQLYDHIVTDQSYIFLNDIAIPTLWQIERSGLTVDTTKFIDKYGTRLNRYINDGRIYSQYNLYTTTGRCSNRFAGVNFASLNKKDGTREMFVSRHDRGMLVMADFESFHLRLIADMIGYELPMDIPVHEFLGKQYFNKDVLTPEEYDEGKSITFKLLYGEDRDNNVPDFFISVYKYIDMLMVILDTNGYIQSPYYKRKLFKSNIENPTPSKVFNYMIQLAETEKNLTSIASMLKLFGDRKSVPILYTYDSLLFDYDMNDGTELLQLAITELSNNGKFPMRVYYGSNYHTLKRLSV